MEFSVLFIDGEAIVIDKPAGLPVDTPRDRSLSVEMQRDALTFGFQRLPTIVHRIDRDTSGCLLLARNPKAHKRFQQAFEEGQVMKRYLAIIDGSPEADSGTIDMALAKRSSPQTGWRMVPDLKGKTARTRWRVLARNGGRAFVALFPETGRTHQLRVHMAEGLGMPIIGDPVYGRGGEAMLLHAAAVSLARPGKRDVAAEAPLPEPFRAAGFGNG